MSAKPPKYRRHKNGQAFVRVAKLNSGQNYYLGPHGSPKSREEYRKVLLRLEAGADVDPGLKHRKQGILTIGELMELYVHHARQHYTRGGKLSPEYHSMLYALKELAVLFDGDPADDFGPKRLRALQKHVIAKGWCRRTVNRNMTRIRTFFRWASDEELIPAATYYGLRAARALDVGQFGVREKPKVKPVDMKHVYATLPLLPPVAASMVQVQYLCGMRPGEVCGMRACDIDMTGAFWLYHPTEHKNAWREMVRTVAIPKAAQEIIRPLLGDDTKSFIFVPPPEKGRRFGRPGYGPQPGLLDRYDRVSYGYLIRHTIKKAVKAGAEITHWHPNQLRHSRATEISQSYGRQAAQIFLGHEKLETTQIYSEHQQSELLRIAGMLEPSLPSCTLGP
jgi:integrase